MLAISQSELSPAEYCERGSYDLASSVLPGWRGPGLRPLRGREQSDLEYAEALQWAAVITVEASLKSQIPAGDAARDMLTESARLSGSESPLIWLGICYYRTGEYGEAEAILTLCLERELSPQLRFLALRNLAVVRTYQQQHDKALSLLAEAESLIESAPVMGRGKFHLQRGLIFRQLGDLPAALREYETADRWFEEIGNQTYEANVSINLARVHLERREYLKAHIRAERAVSLLTTLGDKLHCAKAWDEIARIYIEERQLEKAERAARKAISLVETGDQEQVLAECLITHGIVLGKICVEQAMTSLTKAAEICRRIGDKAQSRQAHDELSRIIKSAKTISSQIADTVRPLEHRLIKESLHRHKGVLAKVASELDVPYEYLRKKIASQFPDLMSDRRPIVKRRKSVLRTNSHNSSARPV